MTPALVTVTADAQGKLVGATDPALSYKISAGQLFNGDLFGGALTRVSGEAVGSYAILQGTMALTPNYQLTYVGANLTIKVPPSQPTSQFTAQTGTQPTNTTTMNLTAPTPTPVSFTLGTGGGTGRTAGNGTSPSTANNNPTGDDAKPAALTAGDAFMSNNGRYFPPISQYDANQYSDFKLPSYAGNDSEATVLAILARGIAQANAFKYLIDGFWNGSDNTWPGPGHSDLLDKASFSDGAGHSATPTNDPPFPIVTGTTDLAALLKNGPVMIGGPADQAPVQWLLATGLAPDGKGIICDDTMTGALVELSYDAATKTLGGIAKLFDAKSNSFVPLADASNDIPASDASGLSGLQGFVPATYYAVTIH